MPAQTPDSVEPDAQPDPLDTESPSAFQSLLRWIGRPGYAARNLLKGNFQGAYRQGADFTLGLIDELPMGGLIPQFSRKEDYPEFSDVIGGMDPGVAKTATDVVGGLVTDPLTYLAAPVSVGARVAKGIQSAETIAKATHVAQIARKVEAAANGGLDSAQVGADVLQQATRPLMEDEVRKTLGQNLSGKGRLYERQTGNSAAEDVIQQANGDKDQLMQLIQNDPRFQQGGLKLRVPILNRYIPGLESPTLFPGKNLDPLSQSLGAFGMVGSAVGNGMRRLGFGDTVDNLGKIGQSIKRGIQAEDLTPGEESSLADIQNQGSQVGTAGVSRVGEMFKDIPEEQRRDLFDVIQNISESEPGRFGVLKPQPGATPFAPVADQAAEWKSRIDMLNRPTEYKDQLKKLADQFIGHSHEQFQQAVEAGAFHAPKDVDLSTSMPRDYAARQFTKEEPAYGEAAMSGKPSAIKARTLETPEDVASYLNSGKADLNRDLGVAAANRAGQQGLLVQKAALAKKMTGSDFTNLTDPEMSTRVNETINAIGQARPDYADRLKSLWEGLPPRGPVMQTIADMNKPFKQAAVMGIMVPRLGSIVGNRISKPFQGIAQQGAQESTLANLHKEPLRFVQDLGAAAVDGLQSMGIGKGLSSGDVGQAMAAREAALKVGGTPEKVAALTAANGGPLGKQYAEFVARGGDDGFVSSEQIASSLKKGGKTFADKFGEFWKKPVLQWPAVVWKSVESRMRFGMYKDMVDAGMDPETAVKNVGDSLYDYRITSAENRALRDVVPFAQFTIKAVKQQAPFVSRTPAVGAALGPVLGANPNDAPVPDYLQGQTHIPLGLDAQGNQKYIAGLRLPIETLNKVPYWGGDVGSLPKQIRQDVVSSMSPPIKTAYSYISGEDPYFGNAFGSYDANPQIAQALGAGTHSGAAKAYNLLAGTGAIQPVSSLVNTLSAATDPRKDVTDRLLNTLTGAKVTSVDEDQALQQQLTEYLRGNPDVSQYTAFYSQDRNPKVEALTKQLAEIKKRIKAKRESAKADASTEIP